MYHCRLIKKTVLHLVQFAQPEMHSKEMRENMATEEHYFTTSRDITVF